MKKIVAVVMVIFVLITIGVLGIAIYNKMLDAEEVRSRLAELPAMQLDGIYPSNNPASTETNQSFILTYFHTECSFCQSEIKDMQAHESLSQSAEIVLVSDETQSVIRSFIQNFDIDTTKFKIVMDKERTVKKYFGISSVPTTFVYDRDSLLIQSFKGETKASVLYDLIK